ncbi:MAG: sulfite exporter TauE/SafE family protein, partial [archaeon]|nr:sulfite exporter TauE/SafE family protein [archaeon]
MKGWLAPVFVVALIFISIFSGNVSAHIYHDLSSAYSFENNAIIVNESLRDLWDSSDNSQAGSSGVELALKRKISGYLDQQGFLPFILLLIFAFIIGVVHSFTPGHGKGVIALYLVGQRVTLKDAVILALTTAITHVLDVFVVMLVFFFVLKSPDIGIFASYLGLLSIVLVLGFGLYGFFNAVNGCRNGGLHESENRRTSYSFAARQRGHKCRKRQSFLLGIFLGLAPCPVAWILFLLALSLNRMYIGFFMMLSFSLGIIVAVLAISVLIVRFKRVINLRSSVVRFLPIVTYFLMVLFGLFLLSCLVDVSFSAGRGQTLYGSGLGLDSCSQIDEQDIYELCLKIRSRDPDEFDAVMLANKFSGHMNPYNVYGAKMGVYARMLLNGTASDIAVLSEAGSQAPISYIDDGFMVGAGSTFGHRSIKNVIYSDKPAAIFFYKNRSVRIELAQDEKDYIEKEFLDLIRMHDGMTYEYYKGLREMSLSVWENSMPEDIFV